MEKQIIIWEKPENWTKLVENLIITKENDLPTIEELKELSPYEEIDNNSFRKFLNSFSNIYVRAYHACRTINLDNYYKNGIKIPDLNHYYELLDVYYKELNDKLSYSDYLKIKQNIKNIKLERKIFFNLSEKELLKYSSHYLIYGSELLFGAFVGIQTMFNVDIPVSNLNEFEKRSLYLGILRNRTSYIESGEIDTDFTISLNRSLPPDFIIGHFHPKEVEHSHRIGELFKFRG